MDEKRYQREVLVDCCYFIAVVIVVFAVVIVVVVVIGGGGGGVTAAVIAIVIIAVVAAVIAAVRRDADAELMKEVHPSGALLSAVHGFFPCTSSLNSKSQVLFTFHSHVKPSLSFGRRRNICPGNNEEWHLWRQD